MNSIYLKPEDRDYPRKLLEHLQDPQPIYYVGRRELFDAKSIAIVGSRNCTAYGKAVARSLAKRAAEYGVTVISGLAYGIDGEAHKGVLEEGGDTIGVIANGIRVYYPKSHRELQDHIKGKGLLVSEYEDSAEAKPYTFPRRNRLITALADAVVIVEAATRSGALITAESAAEQGKLLYSVPGNITSKASIGTNKLIRDGVMSLVFFDDLFRDLGFDSIEKDSKLGGLGEDEVSVMKALSSGGNLSIEDIVKATGLSPKTVNGILTVLEMKNLIAVEMGRAIVL